MAHRGHHEGTISKRSDGRWVARVSLPDGKRKAYYGKTRAEAQQQLAVALRAVKDGLPLANDQQTVATYLREWVAALPAITTLKPDTILRHRQYVELHIIPALGKVKLARLTALQVQGLYADLIRVGLASTTINHLHSTLHKALDMAMRMGVLPRNVCDLVDAPRLRRIEMNVWTPDEIRAFHEAVTAPPAHVDAHLYTLALTTGMRKGELLGLRWRDLDWEHGVARLQATLKRVQRMKGDPKPEKPERYVVAEAGDKSDKGIDKSDDPITKPSPQRTWWLDAPKTAGSRRTVLLAPTALEALRAQRAAQNATRLARGELWQEHDFVFTDAVGDPLWGFTVYHRFLRTVKKLGLPRIRFHDLRHSCATMLLAQRVPVKMIAELLGHSSTHITSDIYSHVLPDMQIDVVAAIEAVLKGTPKGPSGRTGDGTSGATFG